MNRPYTPEPAYVIGKIHLTPSGKFVVSYYGTRIGQGGPEGESYCQAGFGGMRGALEFLGDRIEEKLDFFRQVIKEKEQK